ncbi:YhcG family protein [Prosthecobacter sp.]|uniref:YhcG family protein n=1 Tax=Prosthecobacter sp. TaxID=1965333 RepID=UPI0037847DAF
MKKPVKTCAAVYDRVQIILSASQGYAARSVNTSQVVANWLIGREIVEEQQEGSRRAEYGRQVIPALARQLKKDGVAGYGELSLNLCRQFYLSYPDLPGETILYAVRKESGQGSGQAMKSRSSPSVLVRLEDSVASLVPRIIETARSAAWRPGLLHPGLSWTHYRALMRVGRSEARAFYEIEAAKNHWKARELERQIASLLFERLAKSRDKKGLLALAIKGQEIQQPADVFKDPVVIEFLGLPESNRLVESDLENALLSNLQTFLLELGKGFAFVARQQRLTLEGDHFYVDLVFYHTVLKCYVLLDLKVRKLTHEDLGQMQLYVNYYDQERLTPGDNPTLGLILCTDKNDTAVKYTLGTGQQSIYASRYQLHLPSEADLTAELKREMAFLNPEQPPSRPKARKRSNTLLAKETKNSGKVSPSL